MDTEGGVRLKPADLAKLLNAEGSAATDEAKILEDIAAGAPVGADGAMNLIHYAAWLIRERSRHGD